MWPPVGEVARPTVRIHPRNVRGWCELHQGAERVSRELAQQTALGWTQDPTVVDQRTGSGADRPALEWWSDFAKPAASRVLPRARDEVHHDFGPASEDSPSRPTPVAIVGDGLSA